VNQNSPLVWAEDENDLCELCSKITRLAYLYSNLQSAHSEWEGTLVEHACQYVNELRAKDCSKLTNAIIENKREYFTGSDAKFSREELEMTRDALRNILQDRAGVLCHDIGCCAKTPSGNSQLPLLPVDHLEPEIRSDVENANNERLAVQQEKETLDKLRSDVDFQQKSFQETKDHVEQLQASFDQQRSELKTKSEQLAVEEERVKGEKDKVEKQKEQQSGREKELQSWESDLEKLEAQLEKDAEDKDAKIQAALSDQDKEEETDDGEELPEPQSKEVTPKQETVKEGNDSAAQAQRFRARLSRTNRKRSRIRPLQDDS